MNSPSYSPSAGSQGLPIWRLIITLLMAARRKGKGYPDFTVLYKTADRKYGCFANRHLSVQFGLLYMCIAGLGTLSFKTFFELTKCFPFLFFFYIALRIQLRSNSCLLKIIKCFESKYVWYMGPIAGSCKIHMVMMSPTSGNAILIVVSCHLPSAVIFHVDYCFLTVCTL